MRTVQRLLKKVPDHATVYFVARLKNQNCHEDDDLHPLEAEIAEADARNSLLHVTETLLRHANSHSNAPLTHLPSPMFWEPPSDPNTWDDVPTVGTFSPQNSVGIAEECCQGVAPACMERGCRVYGQRTPIRGGPVLHQATRAGVPPSRPTPRAMRPRIERRSGRTRSRLR